RPCPARCRKADRRDPRESGARPCPHERAEALLSGWPVADLNIEEVDIGTVIEQIFSETTAVRS
ncbi:MAG: hypothetical protein V9F03_14840, partial [Microthrixaceae bacterium]